LKRVATMDLFSLAAAGSPGISGKASSAITQAPWVRHRSGSAVDNTA
jgi:hypothetical protein